MKQRQCQLLNFLSSSISMEQVAARAKVSMEYVQKLAEEMKKQHNIRTRAVKRPISLVGFVPQPFSYSLYFFKSASAKSSHSRPKSSPSINELSKSKLCTVFIRALLSALQDIHLCHFCILLQELSPGTAQFSDADGLQLFFDPSIFLTGEAFCYGGAVFHHLG